jgi:hypothetical protein
MEGLIALLGTAAFSFAAGVNLYATVAILGLGVALQMGGAAAAFGVFDNGRRDRRALLLYVIEFFATRFRIWTRPGIWCYTAIRPLGGAFVAVAAWATLSPAAQGSRGTALLVRHACGGKSPDQSRYARGPWQHQPRTVLELALEPGRGQPGGGAGGAGSHAPSGWP